MAFQRKKPEALGVKATACHPASYGFTKSSSTATACKSTSNEAVKVFTRRGHDWTKRYPWIVEAALKNREQQFVIDGEAVVLGVDGPSDFNALHSRRHDHEVQLYAFDILAVGSEDLRQLPLTMRKTNLVRLLRAGRTAYSSRRSKRALSALTCSAPPAAWASRVWSRNAAIGAMAPAARKTGSR
ncbi:hypothetical protein [Bradyrhizobium barranii]|uniref:ATP-dependent DNA ligase n=1 Tax=Bradyrhizobium barranii TaxID=2992140 RepID=UPI003133C855